MSVEIIQQPQAAQAMLVAAFEFIALAASSMVCAGGLLWLIGSLFLRYCDQRDQQQPAQTMRRVLSTATANRRDLIYDRHFSERSRAL